MRGAPNFLSITTLRPFGPRVTFTAFASASAPSRRSSRASTSYLISFAMVGSLIFCSKQVTSKRVNETEMSCKLYFRMSSLSCLCKLVYSSTIYNINIVWRRLSEHGEHIALAHDEILFAVKFHLVAGIFAVEHGVAHLQHHFLVLSAVAHGEHFAFEGFLFRSVGNDDTCHCLFFCCCGLQEHA